MSPAESFLTSDGAAIVYRRQPADANAPRLALIHSLALDASVWDAVAAELSGEADLVVYDCRGHGQSARAPGPYDVQLFARDLAELLDHLGWADAIVAGCSMGGCVAQAFAAAFPARTPGLGLIDTTAWYGAEAPTVWRERAATAREKGLRSLADFQVTRWFGDDFRAANPQLIERMMAVFAANDLDCYAASCAMLGDADLRSELPRLSMPVEIVVGEEDYATPVAMAETLKAALPDAELTIISKARHLTPMEQPESVAERLRQLMRRVTAPPKS